MKKTRERTEEDERERKMIGVAEENMKMDSMRMGDRA